MLEVSQQRLMRQGWEMPRGRPGNAQEQEMHKGSKCSTHSATRLIFGVDKQQIYQQQFISILSTLCPAPFSLIQIEQYLCREILLHATNKWQTVPA